MKSDVNIINIVNIKAQKDNAKIWVFEWFIVYILLLSSLCIAAIFCSSDYIFSLASIFVVISILTIKLISIEQHRIKFFHELLMLIESDIIKEKCLQIEDEIKHEDEIRDLEEQIMSLKKLQEITLKKDIHSELYIDSLNITIRIVTKILHQITKLTYDKRNS